MLRRCRLASPPLSPVVACLLCRLPTPLQFIFLPPIPPPPSPAGKGGDQGYFMQGAAPLASPGLNPGRHRSRGRTTHPAGVCLRNRQLAAKPIEQPFYWRCRQPRRGGTGGDGTIRRKRRRRLRWSSPPGQIEQVPRGSLPSLLPAYPAFSCPLSPPDPHPRRGRGGPRLFNGAEPGRHRSRGRIARWRRGLPYLAGSAGVSGTRLRRGGFGRRLDLPEPSPAGGGAGAGKYAKGGVDRRQRGKTSSPVAAPCKKIFKSP